MTDFARLVLDVDTQGLRDGERDLNSFSNTASRSMEDVGRSMQRIGAGMTVGITAPLGLFATASVKASSDAAELQSAFNQTFGEMASSMNEWAETTGNAMGRSTQAMQELANSYGLFFNNLPVAREEAARMSRVFAELTQDFASFHNLTEDEAMTAFRSGLAGETEALRRYGIDVSAAAVESRALAMGLAETSKELTEQDKILARYNLILDATKNAQGDVARTSDGTANQVRTAQAAFEELQVAIGEKLLPAITPLITAAANLLNYFGTLPSGVQTTIVAVAALAAALGPLMMVFGSIITVAPAIVAAFGMIKVAMLALLANPILLAAAAVITSVFLAWQNWDSIKAILSGLAASFTEFWGNNVSPVLDSIKAKITDVGNHIVDTFDGPIDTALTATAQLLEGEFRGAWRTVTEDVGNWTIRMARSVDEMTGGMLTRFREFLTGIGEWAIEFSGTMMQVGRDMIQGLVNGILAAPGAVYRALMDVVGSSVDRIKEYLGIQSPSLLFAEMGGYMMEGLGIGISEGQRYVNGAMAQLASNTESQSDRVVQGFDSMAQGILGSLKSLTNSIKSGNFLEIFESVLNAFMRLGGMGVFGSGVRDFLGGASGVPSFAGGGYTGSAPRTGGMDGRGGFLAMLHPRETVVDHTRRGANDNRGMVFNVDARGATDPEAVRQQVQLGILEAAPAIVAAAEQRTISNLRRPRLAGVL
ncbi:Phage tail tape measure protein [uncultured Caudovirales phage]|uniref:Phage tail tape measure protein n=1 Tax=uncultured Caudovirales phage TaxID=2100421 RepID=A0A6J5LS16_9CAUD|nr:Phage tail tape measure protein [uncultured Caudovirales phage]